MIDQATIEQIRNAANIVDVVADYVSLHRSGANYKGLCPFHNERTPSFIVSPVKNYCHCFGCGKGGDPIGFLKELNNYTYREALVHLANKYHIEIKEVDMSSEEVEERKKRQTYLTLLDYVSNYYKMQLSEPANAHAQEVLNNMMIHSASVKAFGIGYAPQQRDSLCNAITTAAFSLSHATDLGLVAPMAGGMSDVINDAVVLPIFNKTGKVTAFSWISVGDDSCEVKLTARNALFNPQEAVFGLFQASHSISKMKTCYIVDTPLDVVTMSQNGITNAIAPLGESLSIYTVNDLAKAVASDSVTIITSRKQPEQMQSTFRIIDQLIAQGINVFATSITNSPSVATSLTNSHASQWQNDIEAQKTDCITWKAQLLLEQAGNDANQRIRAIQNTLRSIKIMRNESSKRIYVQVLSRLTGFDTNLLTQEMDNLRN